MTPVPERYRPWLSGEERVLSVLHAFLPGGTGLPSVSAVRDRLSAGGFAVTDLEAEPAGEGVRWAAVVRVRVEDGEREVHVLAKPAEELTERGIRSLLIVPAVFEQTRCALAVLSVARARTWSPEIASTFRFVADIFATALASSRCSQVDSAGAALLAGSWFSRGAWSCLRRRPASRATFMAMR